jgi:dihydrolipoamide dehydrogenase
MATEKTYDIAFLGGGPAGYVGAIRASQLGLSACVVEKDKPGGVCLNIGCIPSKALINQAESFLEIPHLESLGVKVDTSGFTYRGAFGKSRQAADSLSKGVNFLLKKNNVDLVSGTGKITGTNQISVEDGTVISAKNIVVAAGSRPIELPPFPFDEETVLSSNGALMLEELPESLLILGGGVIGCEFAHIMNAFGVKVTIVEMLDRILPMEDPDTADVLARAFKKRKIGMLVGTKAVSFEKSDTGIKLTIEKDGAQTVEEAAKLLVVVGRRPNTEDLGLEALGIELERGFVPVGDFYETSVSGLFAVGDVVATPLLAHVASKEAEIAVEHIAGEETQPRIDPTTIPSAVYTDPQVAGFGLNSETAKAAGINCETVSFPFRGVGKAVAVEKPEGLVKILFNPESKEILGAQIAGAEATELVHELLLAKVAELLPEDIATMIHAHPTLSEGVMEAARAAEGWAIHA